MILSFNIFISNHLNKFLSQSLSSCWSIFIYYLISHLPISTTLIFKSITISCKYPQISHPHLSLSVSPSFSANTSCHSTCRPPLVCMSLSPPSSFEFFSLCLVVVGKVFLFLVSLWILILLSIPNFSKSTTHMMDLYFRS